MTICFDDLEPGSIERTDSYLMTREEITAFASQYDPQTFHLSEEGASGSFFGRQAASGWHTASVTMRMVVDRWKETGFDKAIQCGIGVEQLRWLKPVYPGDTLYCDIKITGKMPSRSKAESGIVHYHWTTLNQSGEPVMTATSAVMVALHPAS